MSESSTGTLLVELLTEELPPKALLRLSEAFAEGIASGLGSRGYVDAGSASTAFATPRRLAVALTQVRTVAPDAELNEKLMPAKVAFDASGEPTTAYSRKLTALNRLGFADVTLTEVAGAGPKTWDGPDHVYM